MGDSEMKPYVFKKYRDAITQEDKTLCLSASAVVKLNKPKKHPSLEYRVKGQHIDCVRKLCLVQIPELGELLADNVTGQLYRDGKCLSGDMRIIK